MLDHGLYRSLTRDFRQDYSRLWLSIIKQNEVEIEKYSFNLFHYDDTIKSKSRPGIEYHRLFASMLTGRSWEVIEGNGLQFDRSDAEMDLIRRKASGGDFMVAISEVLAAVPRELVLLLKTNDLLRAVDHSLQLESSRHLIETVRLMAKYCVNCIVETSGWLETLKMRLLLIQLLLFS